MNRGSVDLHLTHVLCATCATGLKPYVDAGHLDFAIFDAVSDRSIKLANSGVTLEPGACANPVVVVANYLFDTLYHDIFQVGDA